MGYLLARKHFKISFCRFHSFLQHIIRADVAILAHCVKSVQIRSYFWSVFSCIGLNTEPINKKDLHHSLLWRKNNNYRYVSASKGQYLLQYSGRHIMLKMHQFFVFCYQYSVNLFWKKKFCYKFNAGLN